jgi:hypothetical protein
VREAVDCLLLGVSPVELALLDEATKRAEADLKAMVSALDANARSHRRSWPRSRSCAPRGCIVSVVIDILDRLSGIGVLCGAR